MLSKTLAGALTGFDSKLVEIECDTSNGLPSLIIVGLANRAIDEAKERVRGAIKNSGLKTPQKRITLNLAPADLPKDGTAYDLAMAIAILVASGQVDETSIENCLFIGELALDGSLRPVPGMLSYAQLASELGVTTIYTSGTNAKEASLISGLTIYEIPTLTALYQHLLGEVPLMPIETQPIVISQKTEDEYDLKHVYGQEQAKRALEIAAAGGHNLLFTGPPGAGKTLLARTILSILPPLDLDEIIDITKIHSLSNGNPGVITSRPFRSPHHTASDISLIGGGQYPRPGEISLSHHGVLFLDELPEFRRSVLEVLRQPLEDKIVTVSRATRSVTYPANFMLIATKNPCPCGYAEDPVRDCTCSASQISNYSKKISGPLLDRIDMVVHVKRVENEKLLKGIPSEPSSNIRARVVNARAIQTERFGTAAKTNSNMNNSDIKLYCHLDEAAENIMQQALNTLDLSARSFMRILKVARTIADLDESKTIQSIHLSEALQYRSKSGLGQ